ncbi:MAG TPA: hypothetical protein PK453_23845 [Leptospiraceae bacterium]|nr:hypothetical protein [Leptospiraceae bacterium]HMY66254.1 hypothetical protein [Leptospiraceae bacterium]HNF16708.1 hypothetical protein [Leptospiraceae bacterium]HNF22965.1 hypothetical protein [Leptospiraceae bacterium]HNM04162.1 hypothetical protein [Leptospiraceae bacterium]
MRYLVFILVLSSLLFSCRKEKKWDIPIFENPSLEKKNSNVFIKTISMRGQCYLFRAGVGRKLEEREILQVFDIVGTDRGRIHLQIQQTDFFLGEHSELFIDQSEGNNSESVIAEISSGKLGIRTDESPARIRIGKNILQTEKGIFTVLRFRDLQIHIWKGAVDFFQENERPIHSDEGSYLSFKGSDWSNRDLSTASNQRILKLISVFKIQESSEIYKYLYDMLSLSEQPKEKEKAQEKSKMSEAVNEAEDEEKIDLSRYIPLRKDETFRNNHLKIEGL